MKARRNAAHDPARARTVSLDVCFWGGNLKLVESAKWGITQRTLRSTRPEYEEESS